MTVDGLVLIRNSDFAYDSRMKREANAALKIGLRVIVLSWIRDNSKYHPEVIPLSNGIVRVIYFSRIAKYGTGINNAFNIMRFNMWIYHQLIELKKEFKIVIACDLDVAIPAFIVSKVHGKRMVFDIFDSYAQSHPMPRFMKSIAAMLEEKIVGLVDAVIVCNEIRYSLIGRANPKACIVIHNSPDVDEYSSASQKICKNVNGKFKIAYVGTLTVTGRLLLEIMEQAHEYQEIEFHIGGFGPLADRVAKSAKVNANIIFYGQLKNEDALRLESECDLLFATYDPSIEINRYSAPSKVYEAMAFSKPMVVCKGTTVDEIILANNIGLVISYDASEFWAAAYYLSKNREICVLMGLRARKAYDEYFSWRIMEDRLTTLFTSLLQ